MGLVYANIEILRGADVVLYREGYIKENKIRKVKVKALVDSGAYMFAINEVIQKQLNLQVIKKQTGTLADGSVIELDVVGPVEIHFENRSTTTEAIILPGDAEVLLGAIPMEAMDLVILPQEQRLAVNPKHPYLPNLSLK